jgi:putative membrane protein
VLTVPLADWGMHDGDWGAGWMLVMMPLMLLFWGAIIFGVIWLIRGGVRSGSTAEAHVSRESPVEILERRFAEGAITLEDYQARRKVLVNGGRAEPVAGGKG